MNGTFTYQNRLGSRILSIFILAVTVLVTYCVRVAAASTVLTLVTFVVSLFILSAITIPLNRALFFKEGSYQFDEEGETVTIQLKETYTFTKNQVKGVSCEPVEDRRSKSIRVYKISILPAGQEGSKKPVKALEIFSDNVMVDNKESEHSIKSFTDFGALLKHWKYN
jgi:hypothetical protein